MGINEQEEYYYKHHQEEQEKYYKKIFQKREMLQPLKYKESPYDSNWTQNVLKNKFSLFVEKKKLNIKT